MIGDLVVWMALRNWGFAGVVTYPHGPRAHLVIRGGSRMECGAPLDLDRGVVQKVPVLPEGKAWCYSCIGNAAEKLDMQ